MADFEAERASKLRLTGQDAIIRALESAGGELPFAELQKRCPNLKHSNFAYHLKKLTEGGRVEYVSANRLYRLPLGPVGRADILYWIDKIKRGSNDQEKYLAAEQLQSICQSKRILPVEFRDTFLPFVRNILQEKASSSNQLKSILLAAVLNQMNVSNNVSTARTVKLSLLKLLEDLLRNTSDLNLRRPAREAFLKLIESEADLRILVSMAESLVPNADEELSVFQRLMQAPSGIRSEVRDVLFELSIRKSENTSMPDKASLRARQLLYFFRTVEPLRKEEIPVMLSPLNIY